MAAETEFLFKESPELLDYHSKWTTVFPSLPLAKSTGCVASVLKEHMGSKAVLVALEPLLPGEGAEWVQPEQQPKHPQESSSLA